jgi:hypothetical protein
MAFNFASHVTKQLISLATGVVTITLAFGKNVLALTGSSSRCLGGGLGLLPTVDSVRCVDLARADRDPRAASAKLPHRQYGEEA